MPVDSYRHVTVAKEKIFLFFFFKEKNFFFFFHRSN